MCRSSELRMSHDIRGEGTDKRLARERRGACGKGRGTKERGGAHCVGVDGMSACPNPLYYGNGVCRARRLRVLRLHEGRSEEDRQSRRLAITKDRDTAITGAVPSGAARAGRDMREETSEWVGILSIQSRGSLCVEGSDTAVNVSPQIWQLCGILQGDGKRVCCQRFRASGFSGANRQGQNCFSLVSQVSASLTCDKGRCKIPRTRTCHCSST